MMHLTIYGDSNNAIKWAQGTLACNSPHLQPVLQRITETLERLREKPQGDSISLNHVPRARKQNTGADRLANEAIDQDIIFCNYSTGLLLGESGLAGGLILGILFPTTYLIPHII
eukprot:gb/GECG01004811.1/.p1 GENE.gb/GECG01004811.1/~~gb/GECG01004811.1/.p1  ORF type:complete len:115 (+),score=2.04 gb/GECG01004811.1/:1-345(+)